MEKDFNQWNEKKKDLHNRFHVPFFHAREIWWCALGLNVGYEQDGSGQEYSRPVVILKGMSRNTFIAVPLTSSEESHPMRISIGEVAGKEARALLSQIRVIDAKRLVRKIMHLDREIFDKIKKTIKDML